MSVRRPGRRPDRGGGLGPTLVALGAVVVVGLLILAAVRIDGSRPDLLGPLGEGLGGDRRTGSAAIGAWGALAWGWWGPYLVWRSRRRSSRLVLGPDVVAYLVVVFVTAVLHGVPVGRSGSASALREVDDLVPGGAVGAVAGFAVGLVVTVVGTVAALRRAGR